MQKDGTYKIKFLLAGIFFLFSILGILVYMAVGKILRNYETLIIVYASICGVIGALFIMAGIQSKRKYTSDGQ